MTKRKANTVANMGAGGPGDVPPQSKKSKSADDPAVKEFRWSKTKYHLTYKSHIPKQEYLDFLYGAIGVRKIKHYSIVHENADENDPYEHTHVLFCLDAAGTWKDPSKLDYQGIHPNIKPVVSIDHWDNTWKYHEKAPIGEILRSDPMPPEEDFHKEVIRFIDTFPGPFSALMRVEGNIGRYLMRAQAWAEKLYNSRRPLKTIESFVPLPWQQSIMDLLAEEPDRRTVIWVHDHWGHNGKSYFTKYLMETGQAILMDGDRKDMAYAYQSQPIILLDIPRAQGNVCDYIGIEKFKDGMIFSPKFHSTSKIFKSPHIVVFSNSLPKERVFTADRLKLFSIQGVEPRPAT